MSNTDESVSWRLNDLLKAGKKAKEFASATWSQPKENAVAADFTHWQPKVLDNLPEGARETESLDISGTDEAEVEMVEEVAEPVVEEPEITIPMVAEEEMERAVRKAFAEGAEHGREEAEAQWQQSRDSFTELTQSLREAQSDMTEFYGPLKKLALHLAEQLVRGELTLSATAIERLTKEALKDVEQQGEGPIVIRLNPKDLEKFSLQLSGELDTVDMRADQELSQGSVRVSIDDSAIEDLIEHRLNSLSESLLGYAYGQKPAESSSFDSNFTKPVEEKVLEGAVIVEESPEPIKDSEPTNDPEAAEAPQSPSNQDPKIQDPESESDA